MKKTVLYLFFFLPLFALSQTYVARSITYNGNTVDFLEFLPRNYNPTAAYKYPVIVFFSGQERVKDGWNSLAQAPGGANEIDELNAEGLPKYLKAGATMEFTNTIGGNEAFIVLVPWKHKELEWYPSGQTTKQTGDLYQVERQFPQYYVEAMIAHAKTLNSNLDRVFLTGLSMGAGISWDYPSFADSTAEKIAGIVPVSGQPVYAYRQSGGTAGICNIPEHGVASRVYLGESDPVIKRDSALRAQKHINDTCPDYPRKKDSELKILPGAHDAAFWNKVYDPNFGLGDTSLNMYQWMLAVSLAPESSLPVRLAYFKGKNLNDQNILQWATSRELNSDRIELLRSADGKNYTVIATFKTNENSSADKEYSYKDNGAPRGTSHYQLRQVDKDGKSTLSRVITVTNRNQAFVVEKYPNPVTDRLNVSIEGSIFGLVELQVLDVRGNVVKKMVIRKDQSNWKGFIDLAELAKGVYMFQLKSSDGKKEVSSFIKN